jgi:hypothetical protein
MVAVDPMGMCDVAHVPAQAGRCSHRLRLVASALGRDGTRSTSAAVAHTRGMTLTIMRPQTLSFLVGGG